jgi:enoyl-CoA hydratase/carnithine racemase
MLPSYSRTPDMKEGWGLNFNSILLNREGAVCVLTLNRPDTMNALSEELVSEMDQALELVAGDEEIRVLIITGHEKVFVAGGDIKAMQECDPFLAPV